MKTLLRCVCLLSTALALSVCAWAQQGSITGAVKDATGAIVPNANVTITNVEQGFSRDVTSNASGDYLVSGLPAGHYNVSAKAAGFQQYQIKGLVLGVAEKAR